MAKLSAHGRKELARRETPTGRLALMSDGNILRNQGSGWKQYKRLKPGVDVNAYAVKFEAFTQAIPDSVKHYTDALMRAVNLEYRWRLHTLISHMPEDVDGVYSDINEWSNVADYSDVQQACMWYRIAQENVKAEKESD